MKNNNVLKDSNLLNPDINRGCKHFLGFFITDKENHDVIMDFPDVFLCCEFLKSNPNCYDDFILEIVDFDTCIGQEWLIDKKFVSFLDDCSRKYDDLSWLAN